MSEKQEKVWVVSRYSIKAMISGDNVPFKVFDDRSDARDFVRRMNRRTPRYGYTYHRALKG